MDSINKDSGCSMHASEQQQNSASEQETKQQQNNASKQESEQKNFASKQESEQKNFASKQEIECQNNGSAQEIEQQILLKELHLDKHLKLSNEEEKYKEIIKKSIQAAESLNENLGVKEISYPNDYMFVSLANRVYEEKRNIHKNGEDFYGKSVDTELGNWQLLTVAYNDVIKNGYVGAAYWNPDVQQIIIAHRGTDTKDTSTLFSTIFTDIEGVFLNKHVPQIDSAVTFTDKIIRTLKEINQDIEKEGKKEAYIQLFFTGHSLGGWLAQITTFTAKYVVRNGDNFVSNRNIEENNYHASAIVFDSPGGKNVLERIQDEFMRYGPYCLVDSLDITSYLSAPNFVNACNPQVGEIYMIFIFLTDEDEQWMNDNKLGYTRLMHKKEKIKKVFDPETGMVREDDTGKLRIERVLDWPVLILKDKEFPIEDEFALRAVKHIAGYMLPGCVMVLGEWIFAAFSSVKWYNAFQKELNDFFTMSNERCNYYCDDSTGELRKSSYRSTRCLTKKLDRNYKNKRSINVFTQVERQFLETYNLLTNIQRELPDQCKSEKLFSSLEKNQELKKKTIKILEDYKITNRVIWSKNLQEFIPYVKRMLHFFPEMKSEVKKAQQSLPNHILRTFYQSTSSSYVKTIEESLDFKNDTLKLGDFLKNNDLKILHIIQFSTFLGITQVYKTFKKLNNCYNDNKCHIFLSLSGVFQLGNELFIGFLKKIKDNYLIVIECNNNELGNKIEANDFFTELFEVLKQKSNMKSIFITERSSDLNNCIKKIIDVNQLDDLYKIEENTEVKFNELTCDSQDTLLGKLVIFQGKEVSLIKIVNKDDRSALNTIIDTETIVGLVNNKKIKIGKALPVLGQTKDYYINRKLIKKVKVKEEIFKEQNLTDLFVISNTSKKEFSEIVSKERAHSFFREEDPYTIDNILKLIKLNKNSKEKFKCKCDCPICAHSDYTIHVLKKENDGSFICQYSHGKTLSTIRKYIESYERDLSEDEYSAKNTFIKIVDVDSINKFREKNIIVAAEPGMGKSTALTHLGTQKTGNSDSDESKWLIRINLSECKEMLEQKNFEEFDNVVTFLYENSSTLNTLTRKLLEFRLNNIGNIVLLLDGFDETNSAGRKNIINLLKTLQNSKVENILISTRLHLRDELEDSLSTFAYTFKPLFKNDQKNFLKKFWRKDLDPGVEEKYLDSYIDKLLKFISESIGDKERKFMGIPLQMTMVAEVFKKGLNDMLLLIQRENVKPNFPKSFDLLELYESFKDTKYRIYLDKIGGENINLNNEAVKDFLTNGFTEVHRRLAFEELFPKVDSKTMNEFIDKKPLSEEQKQEINLVGIVQFINGMAVFTHRTFAEYFVADLLVNKLMKSKEYDNTVNFLSKELFESKNVIIKTFLDYRLSKEKLHTAAFKKQLCEIEIFLSEDQVNVNITDVLGRSALHYASQEGHKDIFDILVKNHADIRKSDQLGKTTLHYASRYNHSEIVCYLLENAKDCINAMDKNRHSAVYYAAEQGNWDIVDCILTEKEASIDGLDTEKLLFHYTYKGNRQIVENLSEKKKIDVTTSKDNYGNRLLHIAAQKGHLPIVKFLLEKGADIDIDNNSNKRPITSAAENEHWDIVEFLLKKNSNFNNLSETQKLVLFKDYSLPNAHWDIVNLFIKDNNREDYFRELSCQQRVELLCYNISSKDLDTAEFLIGKDIMINNVDESCKKPIHYAAEGEHWNIIELLLKKKANFNDLETTQKNSLLQYSVKNYKWEIVVFFIEDNNRASYFNCLRDNCLNHLEDEHIMSFLFYTISICNLDATRFLIGKLIKKGKISDVNCHNNGETFLHVAAENGQLKMIQYLVDEIGTNLNATTNYKMAPLHLAARNGHFYVLKYLVDKGANIHAKDINIKTPLDLAIENHHLIIVEYLAEKMAHDYYIKCKYDDAFKVYRQVFNFQKRLDILGPNHLDTLNTNYNMAVMLDKQGEYNSAARAFQYIFEKRKLSLGSDHHNTLMARAEVLYIQCKYREASKAFKHIYEERKIILGINHPDTLITLNKMGEALNKQGIYETALTVFQNLLGKSNFDSSHPDVLKIQNNMAEVLCNQGKYKEALENFQHVFDIQAKLDTLGSNHPDALSTRNSMAVVLNKTGKYNEALTAFENIFDKREHILGQYHPDTLRTRNNMADVLYNQGKYSEALQVYEEVFNIQRLDILGPDHPETLRTQHNVAVVLDKLGKYNDASEIFINVFTKRDRLLGADESDILMMNSIAVAVCNQGDYKRALTMLKEIFPRIEDIFGPNHPYTLMTQNNMAVMLCNQGIYNEASQIFEQVFDLQKRSDILGPEHPATLSTHHNIAVVFSKLGKDTDALNLYKKVFAIQERIIPDHPNTFMIRHNMAIVLDKQGMFTEALKVYNEVCNNLKDKLGHNHPYVLSIRHNIASIYHKQGKLNNALEIFQEVFVNKKWKLGNYHPDTSLTQYNIAKVLDTQDKHNEALEVYQELFNIQKFNLRSDHPETLRTQHDMAVVFEKLGKYKDASEAFLNVFEKRKHILGLDHCDTLMARYDMVKMLERQGEYIEALQIYKEMFDELGDNHSDILKVCCRIGSELYKQGEHERVHQILIEIHNKIKNKNIPRPDTLQDYHNFALLLATCGDRSRALEILHKIYRISQLDDNLGPDNPNTIAIWNSMVKIEEEQELKGCSLQ